MLSLDQLDQLEELILDGTRIPFSSGRLVDEQEAMVVIDQLRQSIPNDFNLANDILKKNDKYVQLAKNEANNIINDARKRRESLISKNEIQTEAQRQIEILNYKAKKQCQDMIKKAEKDKSLIMEQSKAQAEILAKQMQKNKSQLYDEFNNKSKQLELTLKNQHSRLKKELEKEYITIKNEINLLSNKKSYLIKEIDQLNDNINSKCQAKIDETNLYCKNLIDKASKEANSLKTMSYQYAQNTLNEVDKRIKQINNQIETGKNNLNELNFISKN